MMDTILLWTPTILVLTPPHVPYACPKTGIVVIGLSLCLLFCNMYIFDDIQVKAVLFHAYTIFIWCDLEFFTRSGIQPFLKGLWRPLNWLMPSVFRGWSTVF